MEKNLHGPFVANNLNSAMRKKKHMEKNLHGIIPVVRPKSAMHMPRVVIKKKNTV
jgi:hypothetical protein